MLLAAPPLRQRAGSATRAASWEAAPPPRPRAGQQAGRAAPLPRLRAGWGPQELAGAGQRPSRVE